MAKLSEKYVAGFLDADGSVSVVWQYPGKPECQPYLRISFSQETVQDGMLFLIQQEFGGVFRSKAGRSQTELVLNSSYAAKCLNRIRKHLVLKRHYADVCVEMVAGGYKRYSTVAEAKAYLKVQRRVPSLPIPNFPPRKWLAGYFDGDGCVYALSKGPYGKASVSARITAADYDREGIDLLQKVYGGNITKNVKSEHAYMWELYMVPSKAKEFLGYFSKYLIKKRDQADFILACAEMGHYRDGKSISEVVKRLKAHPHRLSDPAVDVTALVATVKDLPPVWSPKTGHLACVECGTTKVSCAGQGRCQNCYARAVRLRKRQSEQPNAV